MATITIRGIEDNLPHRLKMAAARDRVTMKALIVGAIEKDLQRRETSRPTFRPLERMESGAEPPAEPALVLGLKSALESTASKALAAKLDREVTELHNLKTCRIYRCASCIALGKKF